MENITKPRHAFFMEFLLSPDENISQVASICLMEVVFGFFSSFLEYDLDSISHTLPGLQGGC